MTDAAGTNPWDSFAEMMRFWTEHSFGAPERLNQPILPGWSFFSVNQGNSAAPDTEQAIVAKASYGRQLGRLIDAVEELIKRQPDATKEQTFKALHEIATDIDKAKRKAAQSRIERMQDDLEMLKKDNPKEFAAQRAALLAFLK